MRYQESTIRSLKAAITTLCFVLVVSSNLLAADSCPAFDKFSNLNCEELSARLDNYAVVLATTPGAQATIIVYEGKYRKGRSPRRGEAQANAARIKDYLVNTRGASPERIVIVNGGHREEFTVHLYVCPRGFAVYADPNLGPTKVKFRKGKISKREYKWSCLE